MGRGGGDEEGIVRGRAGIRKYFVYVGGWSAAGGIDLVGDWDSRSARSLFAHHVYSCEMSSYEGNRWFVVRRLIGTYVHAFVIIIHIADSHLLFKYRFVFF